MRIDIKKGKGIEGLVGIPKDVERDILLEVNVTDNLRATVLQYREALRWPSQGYIKDNDHGIDSAIVLDVNEIRCLSAMTYTYRLCRNFHNTSLFFNRLLQDSYNTGYNDFTVHVFQPLGSLCGRLIGTPEKPLNVKILGDVGINLGEDSQHLFIDLDGNVITFGSRTIGTKFLIRGTPKLRCKDAEDTILMTPDKETLDHMLKTANDSNRIVFIHPDGTEEIIRDYER